MTNDFHAKQPRDWHGRYAGSGRDGRESGPPKDAEEIHSEAGVRVLLIGGRSPTYQIWKGEELVHEQPATRAWRTERREMIDKAAIVAGRTVEPPKVEGRETWSKNGVRVVVTAGNEPKFQVYKGDTLVHEQPATRAWKSEQAAVQKVAEQAAGITPQQTATAQINGHMRQGSTRGQPVSVREQLDYATIYVENKLAENPALNVRELQAKGRELAEKWAAQGPAYFQRQMQLQISREYQRHLLEEDDARNRDITEEG
jgi:hypothetical protein